MMVQTLILGFLLLQAPSAQDGCEDCHLELTGTPLGDPAELFGGDIHKGLGFSCASCHGGDPSASEMAEAKDPAKGYRGAPTFQEIPDLCGSCHSSPDFMRQYDPQQRVDQITEYRTSVHGQRAAAGDRQVATCTSCHSVHNIKEVKHPTAPVHPARVADTCGTCHSDEARMSPYDLPTDQVSHYRESVHGQGLYERNDLSAPTCNDCHGNHGAVPPGVTSVANVCGNCHGLQRELFTESPHAEIFGLMDLNSCVACHGNHEIVQVDESLLWGENSVCAACHSSDSGSALAETVAANLLELGLRIEEAHLVLSEAERAGMEVSQPIYDLRTGREQIILARHEIHSLDREKIDLAVEEGMRIAEEAHAAGITALEDLQFRRLGLFISLLIIAGAIASLIGWIRFIEKEN